MGNSVLKSYECCIIGAGPAGLGAALELIRRGVKDILIIDKNKTVGGLSRTDIFDGVRFDIGPHRFFTKNDEIDNIWHDTLGRDFRRVSRLTRIFYKKKYFKYPIKPMDALMKLGLVGSSEAIISFALAQINDKKLLSFEDWIIRKFGRKLYETFFKTYTEKVWGIPCNQIDPAWAKQRIKGLDALEIIKNALSLNKKKNIKTLIEEFYFPVLGAGQMYEAMCSKALSCGAKLMLNTDVIRFNRQDDAIDSIDAITSDKEELKITSRQFFSSIPLVCFFDMLDPTDTAEVNEAAGMLRYRDHISVHLLLKKDNLFPDQWLYIHSPDLQVARVANYNNFSKAMVGMAGKTALSAEYFVFKDEGLSNESDASLTKLATSELASMGLIKENFVEKSWVVRETHAYPVFYLGFQKYYDLLKSRIDRFNNLYTIGRAGLHKYNNQDHSLISGILAARNYLKTEGSPYALWDINVDAQYQEMR